MNFFHRSWRFELSEGFAFWLLSYLSLFTTDATLSVVQLLFLDFIIRWYFEICYWTQCYFSVCNI